MLLVIAAIAFLAPSLFIVMLCAWTRWLQRRTEAPRFATWIAYALLALAALSTIYGATAAFRTALALDAMSGGVTASGASQKAQLLAAGISEAMYNGAFATIAGVATVPWLLFASWQWHWSPSRRARKT